MCRLQRPYWIVAGHAFRASREAAKSRLPDSVEPPGNRSYKHDRQSVGGSAVAPRGIMEHRDALKTQARAPIMKGADDAYVPPHRIRRSGSSIRRLEEECRRKERTHATGPAPTMAASRYSAQDCAAAWMRPLKAKQDPEGPVSGDLQHCLPACRSTACGAGNESCTRALSLCFPITFSTVVISEELNYSLVFRPRQQSSSNHFHQRPRMVHPPVITPDASSCSAGSLSNSQLATIMTCARSAGSAGWCRVDCLAPGRL